MTKARRPTAAAGAAAGAALSGFVALLRGINVGRAKRVAMADLRALVEAAGYGDVRTLLNSGNVVFTAPPKTAAGDAAALIERSLAAKLGVTSRVTVLSAAELATVVAENPLRDVAPDPARLLVAVLSNAADAKLLEPLAVQRWDPDALAVRGRVAYLWCATGLLDSRVATALGRALGDRVTTRNWTTITKLHAALKSRPEAPVAPSL